MPGMRLSGKWLISSRKGRAGHWEVTANRLSLSGYTLSWTEKMFLITLSGMLFTMKCFIVSCGGRKITGGGRSILQNFESGSVCTRNMQKLSHGKKGGFTSEMEGQSEMRD